MKYFVYFFLTILLFNCKQSDSFSQTERDALINSVQLTLTTLTDSVRINGIVGWIPFWHHSTEFKWMYKESSLSYDTLVAKFRRGNAEFRSFSISWDSVRIEPLNKNEAMLSAQYKESGIDNNGDQSGVTFGIKCKIVKVDGSWKFHNIETFDVNEFPAERKVGNADTNKVIQACIDSLIKSTFGTNYHSGAILDVDDRVANAAYRVYQLMGYIFEDPNHQLEHSIIVAVCKYEDDGQTMCDSGSIAIIRGNKIIFRSKPMIHHFGYAPLPGFGDLNNDGTTDILFSAQMDMRGYGEALWILSPDSSGGRLLNNVDEDNQSTILGASGCFKIIQAKGEKAKRIEVDNLDSESHGKFVYLWNGRVFTKQILNKQESH